MGAPRVPPRRRSAISRASNLPTDAGAVPRAAKVRASTLQRREVHMTRLTDNQLQRIEGGGFWCDAGVAVEAAGLTLFNQVLTDAGQIIQDWTC
jgi:hypothetical protein